MMYNTSNPAELYTGTTWELLPTDRYLKTTTGTPLSTGGSNSFNIAKENLPNVKLKVDTVTATIPEHKHSYPFRSDATEGSVEGTTVPGGGDPYNGWNIAGYTNNAGAGNTGSISQSTEVLGSGASINVTPTYITIRAWKRLS